MPDIKNVIFRNSKLFADIFVSWNMVKQTVNVLAKNCTKMANLNVLFTAPANLNKKKNKQTSLDIFYVDIFRKIALDKILPVYTLVMTNA